MGTRENKVEKYLDTRITELGGSTRKWVSPGRDGVPDRIVRVPWMEHGVAHFVEVKTIDGKVSVPQQREHIRLIEDGYIVVIVFGEQGVDEYIELLLSTSPIPEGAVFH